MSTKSELSFVFFDSVFQPTYLLWNSSYGFFWIQEQAKDCNDEAAPLKRTAHSLFPFPSTLLIQNFAWTKWQ